VSKLPSINQLKKEDFPDQPWIEKLLVPLNTFMRSVYSALNRGITIGDNISAVAREIEFVYSTTGQISFLWSLTARPAHVLVTNVVSFGTTPSGAVSCLWEFDGTKVKITAMTGLVANSRYRVTFLGLTA
jgi:hypothetical protein